MPKRKKPAKSASTEPPGKRVPLDWVVPSDIKSCYATHIVAQRLENEVVLNFFEVQKPLIIGSPEKENKAEWDKIKSIEAKCVAKVIISLTEMPKFLKAMASILLPSENEPS